MRAGSLSGGHVLVGLGYVLEWLIKHYRTGGNITDQWKQSWPAGGGQPNQTDRPLLQCVPLSAPYTQSLQEMVPSYCSLEKPTHRPLTHEIVGSPILGEPASPRITTTRALFYFTDQCSFVGHRLVDFDGAGG